MSSRYRLLIPVVVLLLALAACNKNTEPRNAKRYDLEGKVVSVDKNTGELVIDHRDIPGFMNAMTMPYKPGPNDKWALDRAQPGDKINATVVVTDDDAYLTNISLTKDSGPNTEVSGKVGDPGSGTPVPDFAFVDQDGKRLLLSELRGGPVLLTFIYTRCPLPNYCIRMSSNFEAVAKQLQHNSPDTWRRVHMLSISFDPEFDKPQILHQYGHSYAGAVDPEFIHWDFVTGTPEEIGKAAKFFGLVYDKQKNQYIHSLRTAVIDRNGKVVTVYHGNEWKPEDVARQLAELK
jgi:protein SCO1/2